jgi:hypothetical protein
VLNGRGFVVVKALPLERWTSRQAALASLAIGVHLGNLRMQNAQGHLLGYVRDLGRSSDDPNTRLYQTSERETHHADSCDVVALLCLRPAKAGGLSNIPDDANLFVQIAIFEILRPLAGELKRETFVSQLIHPHAIRHRRCALVRSTSVVS